MACFDIPRHSSASFQPRGAGRKEGTQRRGAGTGSEGQEGVSREQQAPRRKAAREGCGKRHREAHAGSLIKKHPPRVSTAASGPGGGTAETRPQPLAGQQRASQPPAGLQPSATSSTGERSSRTRGVWLAFFFFFSSSPFFPPDSSCFSCSAGPAAPPVGWGEGRAPRCSSRSPQRFRSQSGAALQSCPKTCPGLTTHIQAYPSLTRGDSSSTKTSPQHPASHLGPPASPLASPA